MPVRIQNDVNACALAERAFGACRDVDDFLWVTVSNGIDGALVLNGRLYEGFGRYAGEIGHVRVSRMISVAAVATAGVWRRRRRGPR